MSVKSHLRRERPVVVAVSTNDGLSGSAENIGRLLNRNNYFFVKKQTIGKVCFLTIFEILLFPGK